MQPTFESVSVKRTSTNVKPSVGDSKGLLRDLLVIATIFITLNAFHSIVSAVQGSYYVAVADNHAYYNYRVVRGNQTTLQSSVTGGVASFVNLIQQNGDYFCVGFVRGWAPNGTTWLSTPYYYIDRRLGGNYYFQNFEQAPVGQNQNHQYWLFAYSNYDQIARMYAFVDENLKKMESGYSALGNQAYGQTETHDSLDQMNSHFFDMKAGEWWLIYSAFHDDASLVNSPYHLNLISQTEWTATGQGSN